MTTGNRSSSRGTALQIESEKPFGLDLVAVAILILLGIVIALIEIAKSPDPLMVIQAWTYLACMLGMSAFFLRRYAFGVPEDETGSGSAKGFMRCPD